MKSEEDQKPNTASNPGVTPTEASPQPERPVVTGSGPGTEPAQVTVSRTTSPKRTVIFVAIAVVALVIAGGAAWYFWMRGGAANDSKTATGKSQSIKKGEEQKADPLLTRFTVPTTGEKWLAAPKQVSDLGYLKADYADSTTYYEVGSHGQSTIYMSVTQQVSDVAQLYEKASDGTVHGIVHPNANATYTAGFDSYFTDSLAKTVVVDTTTHYDSLSIPASISIGNGDTVSPTSDGAYLGSLTKAPTTGTVKKVVKTYGDSKLVRIEHKYADTGLTAINYALDLPTGTEAELSYAPINMDMATYTWDNGVQLTSTQQTAYGNTMKAIIRGCGSASTAVSWANAVTDTDLVAAGKSADGKTIYTFKSSSHALVKKALDEYVDFYKGDAGFTTPTADDFLKQHAIVAYKDGAGEWLVYTRNAYASDGGCAKPVVYLYPTHSQEVTVRLGAQVTKSIPLYDPARGWKVTANPDGALNVDGTTYDSLFWEGKGTGTYPGITSGMVVKRADAAATMATQLRQQGLTTKEANDFLAYWTPQIPNKPYVRLTWFTTTQMNQLAPLQVSPKPDTVIRVFLDMDGFDKPVQLPAQQLKAAPRSGFTVVEWGGLSGTELR